MQGWLFCLGFAVSLALMPVARSLSWRLGMLDRPSARKVHRQPTPLLGGLAIYGGFCAAIAVLASHDRLFLLFLICSTYLLVIGLVDDRIDLHARHRLAMQAAATIVLVAAGVRFSLGIGAFLAGVVTVVWLLGIVNSTNCLDCIDGAAGSYALVACGWFFILAMQQGRFAVAALAAALAGAILGFLRHNFPPASIFMGDLGSTFLGLMLGILSVATGPPVSDGFRFPAEALVIAPISYDFLLVHLRRYRGGIRSLRNLLSSTGKDHLPHRLLALRLSTREADLALAAYASLWGATSLFLARNEWPAAAVAGAASLLALFAGEPLLGRLTAGRSPAPVLVARELAEVATAGGD